MKKIKVDQASTYINLMKTHIFRYLSKEEMEELYNLCCFAQYDPKENIIKEGEIDSNLYIIMKGRVKVAVHEKSQKDIYLTEIGEGDIFGEAALFINMKRTADIYSIDKTEVIVIERSAFLAFIKSRQMAGIKILMIMIYSLLNKLRESNQDLAFEKLSHFNQEEVDALIDSMLNK